MSDKPLQMEEASVLRKPVRRGLGWLAALRAVPCGLSGGGTRESARARSGEEDGERLLFL